MNAFKNGLELREGDYVRAEYLCAVCYDNEPHVLFGTIEWDKDGYFAFDYQHGSMSLQFEELTIIEVLATEKSKPKTKT